MATLALFGRRWRRAARAEALIAAVLALTGLAAAGAGGRRVVRAQLWWLREIGTAGSGRYLVPSRLLADADRDEHGGGIHA